MNNNKKIILILFASFKKKSFCQNISLKKEKERNKETFKMVYLYDSIYHLNRPFRIFKEKSCCGRPI